MHHRSSSASTPALLLLALALPLGLTLGCGAPGSSSSANALRFDPCTPLDVAPDGEATAEQRQAVADALALWNARAGAALTMPADTAAAAPAVTVHFQPAAAPFHGFYDAGIGEVYINDDLGGHPRIVTITHELGHAFGLAHVSGRTSVMNSGNLTVEPTADDVGALAGIWGACR